MAMRKSSTSPGGRGRQQELLWVLMNDQDLPRWRVLNQEITATITKAYVAFCKLYAAKLTFKWMRKNSLFWRRRDFSPPYSYNNNFLRVGVNL